MNMIEVDPKLFITCRLCVEETGVYQIVPEVQKKIKYCFDLEISLLDGLPPLICKKCESMLSHHAQVKEMLHEKQKSLIKKFKENPVEENITKEKTHQIPTTQHIGAPKNNDEDNPNKKTSKETSLHSQIKKCKFNNHVNLSIDKNSPHVDNTEHEIIIKANKSANNLWRRNYKRQFVCRFCSISLQHKKSMISHGKRCAIMRKYADNYKWCWVQVNNINSKCNLTGSNDNIVYEKNKIVSTKSPNYYVIYSLKPEEKKISSESSDENFTRSKRKRKRQRLISESSNDTLVIDNFFDKENIKSMYSSQSDIECVTLDDSDTESTLNRMTEKPDNLKSLTNEKMVNNIVSICYKKYLKRCSVGDKCGKNNSNDESCLQRKLLSIGRKTIHKEGFNQIGLLRYMEQKDLDVIWIPKLTANVSVRTTLKENKQNDDEQNLKSLSHIQNDYKCRDFVDIFEQNSISEADSTNSNDNTVQDQVSNKEKKCVTPNNNKESSTNYIVCTNKELPQNTDVMDREKVLNIYDKVIKNNILYINVPKDTTNVSGIKKILNSNPVANPKKLTKKVPEFTANCLNNDDATILYTTGTENSLPMPIITSTVSLATPAQNLHSPEASPSYNEAAPKTPEVPLPRIKVKPVSELMAGASDKPKGALVTASVWAGSPNETQPQFLSNMVPNIVFTTSPMYVSLVQPDSNQFPQYKTLQQNNLNLVNPNSDPSTSTSIAPQVDSREFMTMHTSELPRKKTHSPFLYFKELLQIHNMNLIDNADPASNMCCIIKFKLRFEQKGITPVTLCLSLHCHMNTFCIQVKDLQSRVLDVYDFSAYWQWEVLKGFKGDVTIMMLQNAKKYSMEIFEQISYFISLLKSVIVITDF